MIQEDLFKSDEDPEHLELKREVIKARLIEINNKIKDLYDDCYILDPEIRKAVKNQFEQINETVVDQMVELFKVDGAIEIDTIELLKSLKFNPDGWANVDDDGESMIIVVEPEDEGPEFIMFDPNQD
jgi:hypothetical protein